MTGVLWSDMHLLANRVMLEELKKIDLVKGDVDEMIEVCLRSTNFTLNKANFANGNWGRGNKHCFACLKKKRWTRKIISLFDTKINRDFSYFL